MIEIYTDGACSGNPGPGGFGVVVVQDGQVITAHQEHEDQTTNNRMEMKAILWALEVYGRGNPKVYSDSAYCVNSFTKWIQGWKANGWTRAKGKKLENLDLIQHYDKLTSEGKHINLCKVAGHAGIEFNELADKLATGKITKEEVLNGYRV